ncbi:hypothetical protein EVAR_75486_1 [Eumeta japonica]|uniref:Uncharacterized protein n=1 Tax=Eumeta variegata TaxID=151549 RepID=A0A4C1TN71_EUMVA|nr:hypothetical protein EVAR_75486_1 [Eumeta japonica]
MAFRPGPNSSRGREINAQNNGFVIHSPKRFRDILFNRQAVFFTKNEFRSVSAIEIALRLFITRSRRSRTARRRARSPAIRRAGQ